MLNSWAARLRFHPVSWRACRIARISAAARRLRKVGFESDAGFAGPVDSGAASFRRSPVEAEFCCNNRLLFMDVSTFSFAGGEIFCDLERL
jgi:hypothetical protein